MTLRPLVAWALLAAACGAGGAGEPQGDPVDAGRPDAGAPRPFASTCALVPAQAEALLPAGQQANGTAIVPGGRRLTPAGEPLTVGGFPMAIRLLPGGKHLVVTDGGIDDELLKVVDVGARAVVQELEFGRRAGKALFYGLAVRADGHLFVSGGGAGQIIEYAYDPAAAAPLTQVGLTVDTPGEYVAGLAFVDEHRILAAYQTTSAVALVDTTTGAELARAAVRGYPYDIAVDVARRQAYVSAWGSESIDLLDLAGGGLSSAGQILVGKNPEGLLLVPAGAPTKLLVTVSDEDSVAVVDLARQTVERRLDTRPAARAALYGGSPNALAVVGERLYVASAGDNALDVFAVDTWEHVGRVPTGFYPTAVVAVAGGLAYANGKGMGSGPYLGAGGDNTIMRGTLGFATAADDATLAAGATQVEANNTRAQALGPTLACPAGVEPTFPLPPAPGGATPIEHVVFVVRENKTYDANLGDLAGTNGDPSLAMYGERYTPNLHALARAFTNGDNFYSNAEASIQGHQWTTAGTVNDFIEKGWLTMWGRGTRPVVANATRVSAPKNGYYFQALARAKIPYVDYGEIVGSGGGLPGDDPVSFDPSWPGGLFFNLGSKDVEKAAYLADEVLKYEHLPRFAYVMLPNNHTAGTEPGRWTPEYMVADNDEATGRIVDALSHSRFWPTTIVFIVEDDPSDGWDHVDAHRSTLIVASPWVRRGYVSGMHYDVPALWRTMEILLGLPPQSQQTATAPAMYDLFTTTPDYTPFTFLPSNIPEAVNPPRGKPAAKPMDLSGVDRAEGLGEVLWEHMMHRPPPYKAPVDADGDD